MLRTTEATPTMLKKINMGCGQDKRAGYLNIDSDPAAKPDILLTDNDLSSLPQEYFVEILANDVLEHIPRTYMMGALFDWVDLLAVGGVLKVQTSSIYGIIDVMQERDDFETIHNWKRCLFGNQAHPGDWHFNGFTEKSLRVYLEAVGLTVEPIELFDRWLLSTTAARFDNWKYLQDIDDYHEFLIQAYASLLGRAVEPERLEWGVTAPNSKDRRQEIRSIVCSEERLYHIGRQVDERRI